MSYKQCGAWVVDRVSAGVSRGELYATSSLFLAAGSPFAPRQCKETLPKITATKVAKISGKEVVKIFGTRM
jgi:hypothetical protein